MKLTFFGVRGSTPSPCLPNARYGGNTSCVALEVPGSDPFVFDLGTGLAAWGQTQPHDGTFHATALVTHFHFDHVQGLPFLAPADRIGAKLDVFGPGETGTNVKELFTGFMRPPYFPISIEELRGTYSLTDVLRNDFMIGDVSIRVRPVPHVGLTVGYRVEHAGKSVAYVSDHQAPKTLDSISPDVIELCEGVDILIHDSQYIESDWEAKSHWGHCTPDYALDVAIAAKVKALALFHHDPTRTDADIDAIVASVQKRAEPFGIEVFGASEKLTLNVGESIRDQLSRRHHIGPMFEVAPL